MALLCIDAKAQLSELDERDLIGIWSGSTTKGTFTNRFYGKTSLNVIRFNNGCNGTLYFDDDWDWKAGEAFDFFFISNDDKLNLVLPSRGYMKFVIKEYVKGESMVLESLSGDTEVQLSRGEPAGVRIVEVPSSANDVMYDLRGMRSLSPEGVYIQSGKKMIQR